MTHQSPEWRADPTGRYAHRYWNGHNWTYHVANGGEAFADPAGAPDGWANIENVRAEWPSSVRDPARDLQGYERALALYERDDYPAMMECANLFAAALAHSLDDDGILHGDDLFDAVQKTLYCGLTAPPDGRTFADSAQKALRIALTIMRENGWQPSRCGGKLTTHFEPIFDDTGNNALLRIAIAPADQPWAGDLNGFFAVAPTSQIQAIPNPASNSARELLDRLDDVIEESDAGDPASASYLAGLGLQARGDSEGALARFVQAARLGSVDAMAEAGHLSLQLRSQREADFWYETAANAGHAISMFNTGIAAIRQGDRDLAKSWLQKSAEAGNIEGYAAMTQLADEDGDDRAEFFWSGKGAEAGHLFCMQRHGQLLARDANGDVPTLRRARDLLELAADRGDIDAAGLAVSLNNGLGDPDRARRFVTQVAQSGNQHAIDRLRRLKYL